ncbi:uncharacterized protein LOC143568495 [Bidens hawaiensis]|uniref:uncharacterized protein LOC143568495 n=1 Tax=Bidens hawaiensis TaxID=980011 RepID=UPI00404AEC29
MVIRKHTKKSVESDQQEDGDKEADVQIKQHFTDDKVAVVESEQHQEGVGVFLEIGESRTADGIDAIFDNVYGDICREFDEAHDECSGSLLIKELEDQWKKNLARYTGKREDETGNNEGDGNGEASSIVMTQRTWESMERLCAKYESGSIKSTPQKKKVSFIVPDFNLESGVKKDDRETLAVIAKGKRVAEPDWEVNTPKRSQIFKFLSEVYCSPHAKRAVSLKATLTKQESKVAGFVFAAYGNHCTGGGVSIRKVIMETLRTDTWVHVSVTSAWASVLNHEEAIRSKFNTVHRLFCSAVMLLPDQYENDLPTRIGFFKEKIEKHLEIQRLRSIVGVDVVLIPIINTKHFYLMAFNLKTPQTFVIDNMGTRGSL